MDKRTVTPPNKSRWSDVFGEDVVGDDLDFLLPRQIIGPDENGIKKVIEHKFNEKEEIIKVVTTTRVRRVLRSKAAAERRLWPKFGDAANEDENSRLTMVSTEEVFLQRPKDKGTKAEKTETLGDSLAQLANRGMLCRTCGKNGDHWTSRCPYKDLAAQLGVLYNNRPSSADATAASSSNKNHYIPPSMRAGAQRSSGEDTRHRNDENSVRVNFLSEDTCEADLYDLFSPFGKLTRVFVATDYKTGLSRGFGRVNFVNKEDAQKAIDKLNGYGYDNLILRVDWFNKDKTRPSFP
ncbi:uncharacterized protein LOC110666890 [Hevea brasiliensis]|uniref:uncharacterized protein LOC110666890 n=1 Tax=Hevea brasiliensis TaxID=3981 RepID=UPI000B7940C0|nr:uncharacterized protein LOC110666890 [Hevea brasiliensis]